MFSTPTSDIASPWTSTNETRPASDSVTLFISHGEALPRIRNRAGNGRRSANTRSNGNSFGIRCASSSTTSPVNGANRVSGSCIRSMTAGLSKSK